jgi:competence protein ComEC
VVANLPLPADELDVWPGFVVATDFALARFRSGFEGLSLTICFRWLFGGEHRVEHFGGAFRWCDFISSLVGGSDIAIFGSIGGSCLGFVFVAFVLGAAKPSGRLVCFEPRFVLGAIIASYLSSRAGDPLAARLCLFVVILFLPPRLSLDFRPSLIIWNVGQGQWVSIVDDHGCWHFDMGGEFAPWEAVMAECRARRNFVSLSHWDWDHVGFVGRARFYLPNICLLLPPQGRSTPRKEKLLSGMEDCAGLDDWKVDDQMANGVNAIAANEKRLKTQAQAQANDDRPRLPFSHWNGAIDKTANASSRVILWRGILMPGDSSRDQEKYWVRAIKNLSRTRILILGHHGSATSTGEDLLRTLKNVRVAIASARFKRYGHPHLRVRTDLSRSGIPLLRTEDWGTIRVAL